MLNRKSYTFDADRVLIALLLIAYTVTALAYSVYVPIYEAPDESGHFDLIAHIINTRSLPLQSLTARNYAHHPPLYYGIAALPVALADVNDVASMPQLNPDFAWPGQDGPAVAFHHTAETFPFAGRVLGIHLARAVSLLAGLLTVGLTLAIGRLLFPNRRQISLMAAVLVAFNPQFLFVTSSVNNDSLLIATMTGTMWQLIRTIRHSESAKQWAWLGVWAGAAILSKSTGVVIVGVVFLYWLYLWARSGFQVSALKNGLVLSATMALVSGWWFVRNQLLYGDPLGWNFYQQAWEINLRTTPFTLSDLWPLLRTQFESFWGVFGWMNIYLAEWYYWGAAAILALGLIGCALALVKGRTSPISRRHKDIFLIFFAFLVLLEIFLIYQNTVHNTSLAQGRYLLPASAVIMLTTAFGVLTLVPQRFSWAVTFAACITLVIISNYILFRVIVPAYDIVPEPKLALLTVPHRTNVVFNDTYALRGYESEVDKVDEEAYLTVKLYWQAIATPDFDHSVFLHVLDEHGQMLTQKDQVPGAADGFVPSAWKVQDIVLDTRVLEVPASVWEEGLQLRVGVYNWQSGERLTTPSGMDHVVLDADP